MRKKCIEILLFRRIHVYRTDEKLDHRQTIVFSTNPLDKTSSVLDYLQSIKILWQYTCHAWRMTGWCGRRYPALGVWESVIRILFFSLVGSTYSFIILCYCFHILSQYSGVTVGGTRINYLPPRVITSVRNGSYRNDDPFNCDRWRAGRWWLSCVLVARKPKNKNY